tara:strand:+ start:21937 stop:23073 length:1137 start_codon:yes stop_codon:yes gene_type:complete
VPHNPADKVAQWAFLTAIATISLQWIPALGLPGAQVSDALFLVAGVAVLFSSHKLIRVARGDQAWLGLFVVGVVASAVINGGSYIKLLGHLELVTVLLLAATLGQDQKIASRIKQALIWMGILAAVTGLLGAVLYFAGCETRLLNHFGDLLPGNYPRVRGTCIKVNMLATIIATGLIMLWDEDKRTLLGRYRLIVTLLLLSGLLFTFSRTWLTVGCGLLALRALHTPGPRRVLLATVSLVAVSALLLVSARYTISLDPTHFWQASIRSDPATRWVIWGDSLESLKANPFWGKGPGSPATSSGWSAHLSWLNIWVVLGLAPLCAFVAGTYRVLVRYRFEMGAVVAVGVILLDGLARDVEDMRHLWVLMGLVLVPRPQRT